MHNECEHKLAKVGRQNAECLHGGKTGAGNVKFERQAALQRQKKGGHRRHKCEAVPKYSRVVDEPGIIIGGFYNIVAFRCQKGFILYF